MYDLVLNCIDKLYGFQWALVADLFLFCYESDFLMSLSDDKQGDIIDSFNTTSIYLNDILNIHNIYFDKMVSQIYPSELQLIKALILKPQMILVLPKLTINTTILILKLSISHF